MGIYRERSYVINLREIFGQTKRFRGEVLALTALFACGMSLVDDNDFERAKDLPKIEYELFSSEQVQPFAKGIEDYDPLAVKKYATVQACLISSEQNTVTPDLRLIDWDKINTRAELEVCLWRIFSSLKYPEPILDWLDFHRAKQNGSENREVFDVYPRNSFKNLKFDLNRGYRSRHGLGNDYVVAFGWNKKTPFKDEQALPFAYFFSVSVSFDGAEQKFFRVRTKWLRSF